MGFTKEKNYLQQSRAGFSLVELIVVVATVSLLGIIFTSTLIQSMRGQSKVNVANQVKQNGQVLLDSFSNEVRLANEAICTYTNPSPPGQQSLVVLRDGLYYRYTLVSPDPASGANGYFQKEVSPTVTSNFDETTPLSSICSLGFPATPGPIKLSDTNSQTGVSLSPPVSGSVFSIGNDGGYQTVTIQFRVSEGVRAGTFAENKVAPGGELFATAVELRGMLR